MKGNHLMVIGFSGLWLMGSACGSKPAPTESTPSGPSMPAPAVDVVEVTTERLVDAVEAVGTIDANEKAQIKPEIAGRIVRIHVEEGQRVRKGDMLVELDRGKLEHEVDVSAARHKQIRQTILQDRKELAASRARIAEVTASIDQARQSVQEMFARLDRAAAVLERARQDEARTRSLYDKEFKTRDDLEKSITAVKQAEADVEAARASLSSIDAQRDEIDRHPLVKRAKAELEAARASEQALLTALGDAADEKNPVDVHPEVQRALAEIDLIKERMRDMTLLAPMDGVLTGRRVAAGDFVDKGALMFELLDVSSVKIAFQVPERYLGRVHLGQAADARVEPYPDEVFRGTVYYIEPAVDEKTRAVLMKMRIQNASQRLKPGLFANVRMVVGSSSESVVVPEEAIVPQGGDVFVFVVEEETVKQRPVKIGVRQPGKVQILDGLSAGARVVVAGIQKIRDGAPVRANVLSK